jgi:hypothetical protein
MEMKMTIEQRRAIVRQKLESIGETITSWSKQNSLDHRIVNDLIDGKFLGTRGVTLKARTEIEAFFGNIFDN